MTALRRKFQRPTDFIDVKKIFIIASEGNKTEPEYFLYFNMRYRNIKVEPLPSKGKSDPESVLQRMKQHLKMANYKKDFEAWLVVDKNNWLERQLEPLFLWSRQKENFNIAVSNPKFEYWLLLHFEDATGVSSKTECDNKLNRHLPDYSKSNFDISKLIPGIPDAIRRTKTKDAPPCEKWPETAGTTVYRLVKKLHNS